MTQKDGKMTECFALPLFFGDGDLLCGVLTDGLTEFIGDKEYIKSILFEHLRLFEIYFRYLFKLPKYLYQNYREKSGTCPIKKLYDFII